MVGTQRLKKKLIKGRFFIRILFFFSSSRLCWPKSTCHKQECLLVLAAQAVDIWRGSLPGHMQVNWTSKRRYDCLLLESSAIPLLYDILFPIIIFVLRIKLNRMLIVCWWDQLAFYSTLQMSGSEGDFSGRRLRVQLAESNPNKRVPLMKRFLSNTASSLNILSVHLHRTDIYAPMSVTLHIKYLFYIFSGVRMSVIPFSVYIPNLSCWTTARNNIRKWRNKGKKLFFDLEN